MTKPRIWTLVKDFYLFYGLSHVFPLVVPLDDFGHLRGAIFSVKGGTKASLTDTKGYLGFLSDPCSPVTISQAH